ncbi:Cdc37 N terminal kinase binding-domain-containing protein [Lactarius hatsudake]|nr:Cdc37 N terminal kinase binding-domain-containing protein [Lactarius hatsudake]
MPLNYSKWDQLKVSDDSDNEGHPNFDNISFIRWKLRDVHEKREARDHRIEQLGAQVACNDVLLARLRVLQPKLAQLGSSYFSSEADRLRTNPSPEAPPTNVANQSQVQDAPSICRPSPPYHHHLFENSAGSSIVCQYQHLFAAETPPGLLHYFYFV